MKSQTLQFQLADGGSVDEWFAKAGHRQRRRLATIRIAIAAAVVAVAIVAALLVVSLRSSGTGWSSRANGPASLHITDTSRAGADITGWGVEDVTTKGYFVPGERVAVFGGGDTRMVKADAKGRLSFIVDLGSGAAKSGRLVFIADPRK